MGPVVASVLPRLHLTVDHTRIVTIPVDVVDLRQKGSILERNEQASIHVRGVCAHVHVHVSVCVYECAQYYTEEVSELLL